MSDPADARNFLPLTEQTYFILLSLQLAPRHGYAIAKDVQTLSKGRVVLSVSTLYTTLKRMLEDGWIRRAEEVSPLRKETTRARKTYELTNLGRSVLNAEVARLEALIAATRTRRAEGTV